MRFIGQEHIIRELDIILELAQKDINFSTNLLFRAPSGYGKTSLALRCATELKSWEYILPRSEFFPIDMTKRLHIIDEVHLIKNPEFLYPFMDTRKIHIFILCTNESGELKEPLINRCIQFIFEPYTTENICALVNNIFEGKLGREFIQEIASNCQSNPRIAIVISQRLLNIFTIYGFPRTMDELRNYLRDYLNINDGLNELHERYISFLRRAHRASLDLISYATHLDKATIKRDIEPYLIDRGIISITARGREIINE
jgi:Holliday junction resolvasome RuvABC ATP-dependent DNA helicase subunit